MYLKHVTKVVFVGKFDFNFYNRIFLIISLYFNSRCRKVQPGNSQFQLVPGTLNTYSSSITADIVNKENDHLFVLKLAAIKDNTFNVNIDEKTPLKQRYRVVDALKGPLESVK